MLATPLKRSVLTIARSFTTSASVLSTASSCSLSKDGKKLNLLCDGEPERRYHGAWLRHNCRCTVCLHPMNQQNIVHHSNLVDLKITDATLKGDSVLVNWESKKGPHSCTFNIDWLKKHDYTSPHVIKEQLEREEPLIAKSIPKADYNEVMGSLESYYEWMKQINYYGMSLLQNVPAVDKGMVKVTDKISPPQVHAYKLVFDVKTRDFKEVQDVSYTSDYLLLHLDQNYLESPPGIQSLLCLEFDDCVEGGESILVDTYPVLQELRKDHPKYFELLTRVPYITHRQNDDATEIVDILTSLKYSTPHITLDYYGRINSFSWSPQFHYPPLISEEETADYYDAYTLLSTMFEESPFKLTHRLRVGEALVMNNRRILHTRNSIKLNGGGRYLQGHYVSVDFFISKLRMLSRQLNKQDPIKRMFNRSHTA